MAFAHSSAFQSTHPVRGATLQLEVLHVVHIFQSTHPVRGATHPQSAWIAGVEFQSTHPVRGATQRGHLYCPTHNISIHAPREGCDRGNGLRIPRYGHSDHSLASIVLYNPLASPPDTQICRIEIPANHPLFSYQTARRTYTVFKSPQPWCEQPGTS